jgi:hypothetical protein
MHRSAGIPLGGIAALTLLLGACSAERSRAVRVSPDEQAQDTKDYRAMLNVARTRTAAEDTLGAIITGLERFRSERGRLPTNLYEMVHSGAMTVIPTPPAGVAYAYDPYSGNVRLVPVDERGKIAVPDDTYRAPTLMEKP